MPWRAAPADIDESAFVLADPLVCALNVAAAKAHVVQGTLDEVILAADTLVVADGHVLGKPTDARAAREMLMRLRARPHRVLTGVVLRAPMGVDWGGVVSTRVVMRDYSEVDVDRYVARGEPLDKAGGYAVQDEVFRPVERLEGCYLNVVGLPLCAVAAGLTTVGAMAATRQERPPCRYCQEGAALVSVRALD